MYIMYCCCRRRGMTALTQSVAVNCESGWLTRADRTIYPFRCKFFSCFQLSWLLFPELPSTSTHGYVIEQSINCFQRWNFVEAIVTEMVEVGFHCSSATAFTELVCSKHSTNLDLLENGKVRHCHLACPHNQWQHNDSAWCSSKTKNVPKLSLHPSVTT